MINKLLKHTLQYKYFSFKLLNLKNKQNDDLHLLHLMNQKSSGISYYLTRVFLV